MDTPHFRIWLQTWLVFNAMYFVGAVCVKGAWSIPLMLIFSFITSMPSIICYMISLSLIKDLNRTAHQKFQWLFVATAVIAGLYGVPFTFLVALADEMRDVDNWFVYFICTGFLFTCGSVAVLWNRQRILIYFSPDNSYETITQSYPINENNTNMDNLNFTPEQHPNSNGNKALVKGLITGALILVMLIPTIFIMNLITEREQRQHEVVKDVSSKWASAQTITGPYVFVPYKVKNSYGKETLSTKELIFLPENLDVSGSIVPEQRLRSIYKVLLYKSQLNSKGNFLLQLPKDIDVSSLVLSDAKICMGITDFKGIEKKIDIRLNGVNYSLTPGLPTGLIDSSGLSAAITLTADDFGKPLSFNMPLQIKGSEQLHFVPLSGYSQFAIQSTWANPSFDGNSIPGERAVTDNGFKAKWEFNKANLPFGTVLQNAGINKATHAFGISMIQPADQYSKTTRSVKYAILTIGLTFALFFIIELMQKKPVHPVQYVLIGLALVIFYTLLLSISEFLLFDLSYLIAALATVSLITLYAKGHFKSWKTAGIFASLMAVLYAFIFVLIRLEDTALLVGSIGLFIVLSLVMYASRKINWYHGDVLVAE
jgi:inner membrane protein